MGGVSNSTPFTVRARSGVLVLPVPRSPIRSRQSMRDALLSHLPLLVGENAQITSRHSAAQQNIASRFVFGEVCIWVVVFDASFEQQSSASEAAALVADCRQNNSDRRSCIQAVS